MSNEIDLRAYLDVLIRRWLVVIAMPILAVMAAVAVTLLTKPTYQATATIVLAPSTISISISTQAPPYYLMVDSPRNLPTAYTPAYYIAILNSPAVVDAVTPRLPASISSNSADKSLFEITTRGNDAKLTAQAATMWAQVGAQQLEKLLQPTGAETALARDKLDAAQRALDKFLLDNKISDLDIAMASLSNLSADKRKELQQLARDRDLTESIYLDFAREHERATILAASTFKPKAIPATVPDAPVAPKLTQNLLVGALLGLLLGILGAFAVDWVTYTKSA